MSKVLHSRVFRFLVCLVLVAAFLVNLSPLKAEATAVVVPAAVLTFEGLMAALYSMGIGIVATALTVEAWNNIGNSLTDYITDTGDTTITEAWIDLEAMYDSYIPGGGLDPDDELKWAEKLKTVLSRGLLGAIAGWLCTLVNMGGYEVEGEEASTGYSYFNGVLLPSLPSTVPDTYSYAAIQLNGSTYSLIASTFPLTIHYVKSDGLFYTRFLEAGYKYCRYTATASSTEWTSKGVSTSVNSLTMTQFPIVWSNYDLVYESDNSVLYSGSEPSSTQTTTIEPIYVGDIPQQIQDGEKDKDNLVLPVIDPFRVIQSPETALDDINRLQQQLANGTTTLDQYLEQVQLQDPSGDSGSTTPSDPSTDPSDSTIPVDGPVQDIKPYGLDLKDYFPFCIPFDIYDFFSVLIAEPQAPQFHWELQDLSGNTYSIDVDLSPWDSFAAVFRRMQLLLFIVGLAAASRKFIKW